LRDIARDIFIEELNQEFHASDLDDNDTEEHNDSTSTQCMIIPDDEDDTMIVLSPEILSTNPPENCGTSAKEKKYSKLFDDVFHRPPELESMCLWDILRNYVKEKKPKSKTQRNTSLTFKPGHSQYLTHCLKKLESPVIPVLMGYRVP
jgi:hypothetical protein